jgi:hypothetical protein
MTKTNYILAAVITASLGTVVPAQAPLQTDRTLAKEPKYVDSPKYFLLVFGPEAKTRVWCVLDGDKTLYVDRNHNGDLTEPGERFGLTGDNKLAVGDITESDGKTTHSGLTILGPIKDAKSDHSVLAVWVDINGEYTMSTNIKIDQSMARPKDAPVRHFHGPMSILSVEGQQTRLIRGAKKQQLSLLIGIFDPTREEAANDGVFLLHDKGVPRDVHPSVEIVFPPSSAGGEPIVRKTQLTERC